jgi:hypothetical protein
MGSQDEHYAGRTNAKHLGVVLCDGCDNGGWKLGLGVGSWELGVGSWRSPKGETRLGARAKREQDGSASDQ